MQTSGDRERLAQHLYHLLFANPGQDKHQLYMSLRSMGWSGITKSDVNSALYSFGARFMHNDYSLPLWYARSFPADSSPMLQAPQLRYYKGPYPRDWQSEAFEAWRAAGHRGVVEAVTGTGKTTVGIIAAADATARGLRTLIIVPGRDLLDQWYEKLTQDLPDLRIGRFGATWTDALHDHHIVVSTVQSGYKQAMLPYGLRGLLIADEVHHYGADQYALALEDTFEERLGLTATYEREDNGIARHLTPYFSPQIRNFAGDSEVVAGCDYARGLADRILAPFQVGLVGVNLTHSEQQDYDRLNQQVSQSRSRLISVYNCPQEPFGEFMREVTQLSKGNNGEAPATRLARRFLNAFTKRRSLLADCERKIAALELLAPLLASAERARVFAETVQSAEHAAETLGRLGIHASAYTSKLERDVRKARLSQFHEGSIRVLAAPRLLDEGVDLPKADVGVIVAASHSRRQMIQRMGRIIRPKDGNRTATFIVLYVSNTSEDPKLGAHDAFLGEMMDKAEDFRYFDVHKDTNALRGWHSKH